MKILIDNGHGCDTPGKCSPDRRLLEWRYTREIAAEVIRRLKASGFDATLLVPESSDISLSERARRANLECGRYGNSGVCLVSIHVNAAGADGKWHDGRGWEAWTSPGCTAADTLAERLYDAASHIFPDLCPDLVQSRLIRTDLSDGDRDKEARFTILTASRCPACLTENLFQDNLRDVDILLSPRGREAIVRLHVEGIKGYIKGRG